MAPVQHPDVGKRLGGKYELVALAGEGGMAEVFRAITHGAAGFRRSVAVKQILEHLSEDPQFVAMFVEEARVTATMTHPNIVQIHDFDEDDGHFYLVMEWVDGVNLFEWQRAHHGLEEPTPWHLVTAIGIEVLKALGAAHENTDEEGRKVPVYHRDVTPQNILVGSNGVVKLTDFGLARAMDRARMTQPEMVKGKLSYLAPELTAGDDPSVKTDLFGVGIVLWETLVGRKLFDGSGPLEILTKVRDAKGPPLREERPDVPRTLHDVVHRALAKNPDDRYRSARSMVRALANILRMTPESTSADVLAKTVRRSQEHLERERVEAEAKETGEVLASLEDEVDTLEDFGALPLTRKKS